MKRPIAAPSWVIPADIAENIDFLQDKVEEVELCLFELDYALTCDLPTYNDKLKFHIHLPFDIDFSNGSEYVIENIDKIMKRFSYMQVENAVIHPPKPKHYDCFAEFVYLWQKYAYDPSNLILENIVAIDVKYFLELSQLNIKICIDLAHLTIANQHELLSSSQVLEKLKMFHFSSPFEGKDKHKSLIHLSNDDKALYLKMYDYAKKNNIITVLEIFNWEELEESYRILTEK